MIALKKMGDAYSEQEIMTISPLQLLVKAYDAGIAACKGKDKEKASMVIAELIDSLNFDQAEISNSLFRLYKYCMQEVKQGHFDVTLKIFKELRQSWEQLQVKFSVTSSW